VGFGYRLADARGDLFAFEFGCLALGGAATGADFASGHSLMRCWREFRVAEEDRQAKRGGLKNRGKWVCLWEKKNVEGLSMIAQGLGWGRGLG